MSLFPTNQYCSLVRPKLTLISCECYLSIKYYWLSRHNCAKHNKDHLNPCLPMTPQINIFPVYVHFERKCIKKLYGQHIYLVLKPGIMIFYIYVEYLCTSSSIKKQQIFFALKREVFLIFQRRISEDSRQVKNYVNMQQSKADHDFVK